MSGILPRMCGTCSRFYETRGTYGRCIPRTGILDVFPWWLKVYAKDVQTNVRPDEGMECPAWKPGTENV